MELVVNISVSLLLVLLAERRPRSALDSRHYKTTMTGKTLRHRKSSNKIVEEQAGDEYAADATSSHNEMERYVKLGHSVYRMQGSKRDPMWVTALEVFGVLLAFSLIYTSYYYYDHLHFHVSKGYAHLGYSSAQHVVGQRYLAGKGTDKNDTLAMQWFRAASDQGHAEASYNLAVGHMHGSQTNLKRGEPEKLLRFAAGKGVKAAHHALNLCARRGCD
ncbi:uncharacterized protein LOC120327102 [Styela clava]